MPPGALYFRARRSLGAGCLGRRRATCPPGLPVLRHVGLYAYRVGFLRRYAALEPSPLEHWEALEQLRALWHGHRIRVHRARPGAGRRCRYAGRPGAGAGDFRRRAWV